MKTFKHRETGETATYEDGIMTQGRCSVEVGREPSSEFWEEIIDNNPLKLEVGKTYKIQYKYCPSSIQTVTITKFTKQGFPWSDDIDGIITDYYNLIEEVVEKDYEILQMKNSHGNSYSLFENEELSRYEKENHIIYSVKRFSDSEVFTVGDYVRMQWNNKKGIIESIYYNEHNQLSFKIEGSEAPLTSVFTKKYPIKLKQPLFTTFDGVDIFEGDKFWFINKTLNYSPKKSDYYLDDSKVLYFSTKEAAEEYILMNKPCLSYEEVLEQIPFTDKDKEIQKNLRELVKSK